MVVRFLTFQLDWEPYQCVIVESATKRRNHLFQQVSEDIVCRRWKFGVDHTAIRADKVGNAFPLCKTIVQPSGVRWEAGWSALGFLLQTQFDDAVLHSYSAHRHKTNHVMNLFVFDFAFRPSSSSSSFSLSRILSWPGRYLGR